MKRKTVILTVAAILLVGITFWYNAPIDLINLNHNDCLLYTSYIIRSFFGNAYFCFGNLLSIAETNNSAKN